MDSSKKPSLKNPQILFLSFLGLGFSPYAPGTVGTLGTLPFLYIFNQLKVPGLLLIPFFLILFAGSCFIAESVQKSHEIHDPSWIVVDEVLGMLLTWMISPHSTLSLLLGFAFFRFFDIVKIWPASYFDQKVTHGYGTIVDDVVSGIYAGLCLCLIHYFYPLA